MTSTGSWKARSVTGMIACTPTARNPQLFLRIYRRTIRSQETIRTVKELRRHITGMLVLIWDGLGAHTSKETRQFLKTQRHWLRVYRFPAYAPELNPVEYLWSSGKNKDFAHLDVETMPDLDIHIKKYKRRLRRSPRLLTGFLKKSSLFNKELS
jgi:transposase